MHTFMHIMTHPYTNMFFAGLFVESALNSAVKEEYGWAVAYVLLALMNFTAVIK